MLHRYHCSLSSLYQPFLGACENVLLVAPLVPQLTRSELHQIMTAGFATISGSTLYVYMAIGVSSQALLASCIMLIPCSIAISKLYYPETEESITKTNADIPIRIDDTTNILHAASKGAEVGIKVVFLIMANIISILAILYAFNEFLTWLGQFVNIQELTLQMVTGYLFVPVYLVFH
jgi:CNT family concentrative nucleoside transporter